MDDELERVLREKLSDYQDTPPADALPHILKQVNPKPAWRAWYGRAASVLALLLLSWAGWQWAGINSFVGNNTEALSTNRQGTDLPPRLRAEQAKTQAPPHVAKGIASVETKPIEGLSMAESVRRSQTAKTNTDGGELPPTVAPNASKTLAKSSRRAEPSEGASQRQTGVVPNASSPPKAGLVAERNTQQAELKLAQSTESPSKASASTSTKGDRSPNETTPIADRLSTRNYKALNQNNLKQSSDKERKGLVQGIKNEEIAANKQQLSGLMVSELRPKMAAFPTWGLPAVESASLPATAPIEIVRKRSAARYYLSLMPLYGYQSIRTQSTEDALVENLNTVTNLSSQRIGWRLQTGFEFPISTRIKGRAGLAFTQQSRQVSYQVRTTQVESVAIIEQNAQSVTLIPTYRRTYVNDTQPWYFAGTRTGIMYSLSGDSFEHFLTVGTEIGAKISGKAQLSSFLNLGYGFSQSLGEGITLRVESTLNYALTSHLDDAQHLRIRPYSIGLTFGLVWGLN